MENNGLVDVVIEKLIYGGYGLARYNNEIYMVENVYPQDIVRVKEKFKKKNTIFASVEQIIKPSPYRTASPCKHFPKCGGCQWLGLKYEQQLQAKHSIVEEQFRRIGSIEVNVSQIIESDDSTQYRSKMEFGFSYGKKTVLGLKEASTHNIIDINNCIISPAPFDKIRNTVKSIISDMNLSVYDPEKKSGVLKHLVLRKSFSKNETMLIFVTHTEYFPKEHEFKEELSKKVHADSIVHVMNTSDTVTLRGPYKTWKGEGVLREEFDGFLFQIPPTSFFQNNYNVTHKMLNYILKYFKTLNTASDSLLDLYCGVGLFSIYFAPLFKTVYGVETSKVSIKAACSNSNINSVRNTRFSSSKSEDFILQSCIESKKFSYAIIDPPREGIGVLSAKNLAKITEKAIVYISCDPTTLARDIRAFMESGFEVLSVQPFYMFPNTYHVETVVILEKKNV